MAKRRTFLKFSLLSLGSLPFMNAKSKDVFMMPDEDNGMKRVGLIGGTSWHSTIDYYRYINQMVNDKKGDRINPPLLLFNLNQRKINDLQAVDKWNEIADIYVATSNDLVKSGAQAIVFCSNTAHAVYGNVSSRIAVPVLHIADATAIEAKKLGLKNLGLIGTKYTMDKEYLKNRFTEQNGISVIVPDTAARKELGRIVRDELSNGELKDKSKKYVIGELDKLKKEGAQGMILGCTEFPMLIKQEDYSLPVFDTTYLHSKMAVDFILGE